MSQDLVQNVSKMHKNSQIYRNIEGPDIPNPFEGKIIGKEIFEAGRKFSSRNWQTDATSGEYETFGSMRERAVRLAIQMQTWGFTYHDVISCCSGNSQDILIAVISTFFIGAKIAMIDPHLTPREMQTLLNLVHPTLIFVEKISLPTLHEALRGTDFTYKIVVFDLTNQYDCFIETQNPYPNEKKFEPVLVSPNETAIIIFNKGTGEGEPRATCHSHISFMAIINRILNTGFDPAAVLYFTSLFWLPAMYLTLATILVGGCRFIVRSNDVDSAFSKIEYFGIKTMYVAPALTFKLTNNQKWKKYSTSTVTTILTGGSPISNLQLHRLSEIFTKANIIVTYEITELGPLCTYIAEADKTTRRGYCGKVCCGVIGRVVDIDTGRILNSKERGELRFNTISCFTGYYNVDKYMEFFDEYGFFKTGDIGYYDDNCNIYLIGRTKEIFKYMSWPIVPSIIERAINEHPAVYEAVVFGIPAGDLEIGELPTAWIVLRPGMKATVNDINKFINERISDNEKLRGGIVFKKSLPKSANGKILRKEIRNKYILPKKPSLYAVSMMIVEELKKEEEESTDSSTKDTTETPK